METEQIIEKLRLGLQICHEENKEKVSKENMSLQLAIEDQKMMSVTIAQFTKVDLIDTANKNAKIKPVKISDLFGITMAESLYVNGVLTKKLKEFSVKEQIPEDKISAQIYTTNENFYPAVRICQHGQPKREITIEELTN